MIKRYFLALKLHFGIVWRRCGDYEDKDGNIRKARIPWGSAWDIAKGVWIIDL